MKTGIRGIVIVGAVVLGSCSQPERLAKTPSSTRVASSIGRSATGPAFHEAHSSIYARTALEFDRAVFLKPNVDSWPDYPVYLAPLIVQEAPPEGATGSPSCRIAGITVDSAGRIALDPARPTVYAASATAEWSGSKHEQRLFLWFYAADAGSAERIRWRAIRVTFDGAGFPAIWESWADDETVAMLFVAKSLEAAAAAAYGPALPGRRYAVEAAMEEQPDVVVARVLDDGPAPMGPIVYLDAANCTVTTVICRCMPSQFDGTVESGGYALQPLESLASLPTQDEQLPRSVRELTGLHPERADPAWPQHALRLPPGF